MFINIFWNKISTFFSVAFRVADDASQRRMLASTAVRG
jgi:hypothetical protein